VHYPQSRKSKSKSNSKSKRGLEFIHIPKTGGTVIESTAGKNGIAWTICHFISPKDVSRMTKNIIQCPPLSLISSNNNNTSADDGDLFVDGNGNTNNKTVIAEAEAEATFAAWRNTRYFHKKITWWHVPPSYFFNEEDINGTGNGTGIVNNHVPRNPYDGADLFAIVRNPYDRILSEYYYQQTHTKPQFKVHTQKVRYLNEWITSKLKPYSHVIDGNNKMSKRGLFRSCTTSRENNNNNCSTAAATDYLIDDGHFIPQFDYIYDNTYGALSNDLLPPRRRRRQPPRRIKIVDHVLKFETLRQDFHSLMRQYGNGMERLQLPLKDVRPSLEKKLGLYNLTFDNLQLIERIYKEDFEVFGYEMQSTKIPVDILKRNSILNECKLYGCGKPIS